MMMDVVLPRGITGFWGAGEQPAPTVEHEVFRALCLQVAKEARARLLGLDVDLFEGVIRSYHQALFQGPLGEQVLLLCNAHYPWLAVANPEQDMLGHLVASEHDYREAPTWMRLPLPGFRLLGRSQLVQRVVRSDPRLSLLAQAELDQVRYWKPSRLGDVIFQLWD